MNRSTRLLVALAVAAVSSAPFTGSAAHEPDCTNRDSTFATLLQPKDGQLVVKSQAGTITFGGPTPTQGIMVSTTGTVDVEIDQSCIKDLTLTVTKDGDPTPIHTKTWALPCEPGTHTTLVETVEIGLDGGEYTFELGGSSCGGIGLKSSNGSLIGDPPLPL